jgi:uncharacterized protein YwqG
MNRNLLCWAGLLVGYVGLFVLGHTQPIRFERNSKSFWARVLRETSEEQYTPRPDPRAPAKAKRPAPAPPPAAMPRAQAEEVIKISACGGQAWKLTPLLRPAVRVSPVWAEDAGKVQRGVSRLGGVPDVPAGFVWPTKGTTPLTFLGQINLADVTALDEEGQLPKSGWLCFFYGSALQPLPNGADPNERGAWQVCYFEGEVGGLQRATTPKAIQKEELPLCTVRFWSEWNLPSEADEPNMFVEDERADGGLYDLCEALAGRPKEEGWHHLLGYGQGWWPMREHCQLAANGVAYDAEDFDPNASRVQELLAGKDEWVLLFQVDAAAVAEMDVPPGGVQGVGPSRDLNYDRVQYWIRRADLAAKKFDGVWVAAAMDD